MPLLETDWPDFVTEMRGEPLFFIFPFRQGDVSRG